MSLISMGRILKDAQREGYAVGGFDTWNLESVRAIISAAEQTNSPAILLTGPHGLGRNRAEIELYAVLAKEAISKSGVPIAMLLNEAHSLDLVVDAIRCGFTGVMVENPSLSFDENTKITKKAVEIARAVGVSVEAQIGRMPLPDDIIGQNSVEAFKTDPAQAAWFVEKTQVDALSVLVGNIHTLREGKAPIDLARLEEINKLVPVPLVIHGGTGFPDDLVKRAIALGVCKFNVGLALREAFIKGMGKAIGKTRKDDAIATYTHVEEILSRAQREMKHEAMQRMKLYGAAGRGSNLRC